MDIFTKINWEFAPEWANFAVQAQSGKWYWFEFEPTPNIKTGYWERPFYAPSGRNQEFVNLDWQTSMIKR